MTQNTSSAVMQRRVEPQDSLDFFPTPPWATRALCEYLKQVDPLLATKRVWEPACGAGHMTRPLAVCFELVFGSDVTSYGHGSVRDFLFPGDEPEFDWIITNPPFRLAEEFAQTAIDRAREGVAMLVRSAFLESVGRYQTLFSRRKPSAILQFTERVPMHKGRLDPAGSTATSYCWLVWRCRPHKPDALSMPMFVWIPPCRRKLERPGDYDDFASGAEQACVPPDGPGPEAIPLGLDAGASAPGREPDTPMDPAASNAVPGKHGATSGVVHDARSTSEDPDSSFTVGRASSSDEFPDIPDFLRRKPKAAA